MLSKSAALVLAASTGLGVGTAIGAMPVHALPSTLAMMCTSISDDPDYGLSQDLWSAAWGLSLDPSDFFSQILEDDTIVVVDSSNQQVVALGSYQETERLGAPSLELDLSDWPYGTGLVAGTAYYSVAQVVTDLGTTTVCALVFEFVFDNAGLYVIRNLIPLYVGVDLVEASIFAHHAAKWTTPQAGDYTITLGGINFNVRLPVDYGDIPGPNVPPTTPGVGYGPGYQRSPELCAFECMRDYRLRVDSYAQTRDDSLRFCLQTLGGGLAGAAVACGFTGPGWFLCMGSLGFVMSAGARACISLAESTFNEKVVEARIQLHQCLLGCGYHLAFQ